MERKIYLISNDDTMRFGLVSIVVSVVLYTVDFYLILKEKIRN